MVDLSKFGKKHECGSCGTKFYDLNKPKPVCPKCGAAPSKAKPKTKKAVLEEEIKLAPELPEAIEGEDQELREDLDLEMDVDMDVEDFGVLDETDTQGLPRLAEEDIEEEEDTDGGERNKDMYEE